MAKYDDFGRPIYETAEEYNKAHKGGVCPRGYDSSYQQTSKNQEHKKQSAAQRHTIQVGNQKGKAIAGIIIGGFAIIYLIIFGVVMMNTMNSGYGSGEEVWTDTVIKEEYLGGGGTPLPEGYETFSYNGVNYTLPMTYQDIFQMGLFLEEDFDENDCFPEGYEELMTLFNEEGYLLAEIRINSIVDEMPLGKCVVDYFYLENLTVCDEARILPAFTFGNGLTFESTYEEVEEYFGVPHWHYGDYSDENHYYDMYQWIYFEEVDEMDISGVSHFVQVTFVNGVIESVTIEKKEVEEKY